MRRLPGWRQRLAVGVDLGTTAIKAVALDTAYQPPRLAGFTLEPLPVAAIREGEITDPKALAPVVRNAVRKVSPRDRQIALAIPAAAAISRHLRVPPGLTDRAIAGRVALAVDELLHQPRHTLYTDFQVASSPDETTSDVNVLLVATHRKMIDQRLALLRAARLQSRLVDVEDHALARLGRWLPQTAGQHTIGLIDAGERSLRFSVIAEDEPVHRQVQAFSGPTDTEQLIISCTRAVAVYQGRHDARTLNGLYITGGRACSALCDSLSSALKLSVFMLDPLTRLTWSDKVDGSALRDVSHRLSTALGLALHAGDPHAHWR